MHVDSPHVNIPNTESDIPTIILENRIVLNTLLQCGIGWAFIRIGVYSSETSSRTGCSAGKCTGMWQKIILLQIQ